MTTDKDISKENFIEDVRGHTPVDLLEQQNADEVFTPKEARDIVRKIDWRLIVPLGLMLGANLIDRTNLGNTSIAGMTADLELNVGSRYNIILLVFFGPYVLAQLPCAIIVRKWGPRTYLPLITLLWGIVMLSFAFVRDWRVMIALRVLLGVVEAGLFPGAIYLLSLWYTRYQVYKRYSSFYLISVIGAAFSGVLAYVFSLMKGLGGLEAWRWIFVMEGLITIIIAFIGYAMMVGVPQDSHKAWKFLSKEEEDYILRTLENDRHDAEQNEEFQWGKFLRPATDPKIWGFGFLFFFSTIVAYAISYFLPIILLRQLKFELGVAQLLSTPPFIWACILMLIEAWLGDCYHIRGPIIMCNSIQSIVGLCLLAWTSTPGVQYLGVCFVAGGCHPNLPAVITWQANNVRGQWKRSFCSASLIAMGGVGGIVGSVVYRAKDAPRYLPGIYASIVCYVLTLIVSGMMMLYFSRVNKQADNGHRLIEGLEGFRYTL
ncbi:uncharacterized protein A1O9_09978 [Exophiala aquamarina CBS 119918]|uniref:Major facilitator superfamily (MFS) profile domain-containing protein n=1 Tax=Exophiala aquamarina CBS 119918 TaxID=1182545 RepID=A0A072P4J6_9EURO|nr:uncharacterized protein A1O9_09978 [Exophiala aquamarina CBS 119918]KEF54183.1 hypothetical protein A1O9_09978 [Exophiala aquamarina CBS 119918]